MATVLVGQRLLGSEDMAATNAAAGIGQGAEMPVASRNRAALSCSPVPGIRKPRGSLGTFSRKPIAVLAAVATAKNAAAASIRLSIGTSPASVVLSVCAAASCVFKCHPSRNPHAEELSNRVRMCDLEEHPPDAAAAGGSRGGLGVPGCHAHIATNGGSATTGFAAPGASFVPLAWLPGRLQHRV